MTGQRWKKSSYTHANGNCVEVATTFDEIRDSKDPHGPTLRFGTTAFAAFVRAVKVGRFDR